MHSSPHKLSFRPFAAGDLPLMFEWLQRSHVKEWWDDSEDTMEKVTRHYGETDEDVERFILLEANSHSQTPIGYFQFYLDTEAEGVIGIDQFIGEERCIGRGLGTQAVKLFVQMISERLKPKAIILDPDPQNKRAIRCYEKAGFRHYDTRKTADGSLTYMMRIDIDKA